MTFVITNGCCNDTSCIPVCPVQCIRPRPGDPDFTSAEQLYIDPATCIDCGACMDECPVNAIHSEWDLPDHLADYLDVNSAYFETNPIEESSPPDPIRRRLPADRAQLTVAIVGTGPAGCYAAAELSDIKGVTVSMFERLPTPLGLVRYGVAPDHANTKLIGKRFTSVFSRANVHCYFNVSVGTDVSIQELLEHHHAVLWAAGASDDRKLGIPGEDLAGSVSAREFVAWYNGHPDFAHRSFDLSGERVVVIGNGNVALDAARILATPADDLGATDIADHALDALRGAATREVVVTARRGPEFAAYTTGELSGLANLEGVTLNAYQPEVGSLSTSRRRDMLLAEAADRDGTANERTITLRFGLTPESIRGDASVEEISFRGGDGSTEALQTSLVIRAIGYRGVAVTELPFDDVTGTLPNLAGSVCDPVTGESVVGAYCSGWIKRGATGVIGTNKSDSAETVDTILHDFGVGRLPDPLHDREQLDKLITSRQPEVIDSDGWAKIDQAERRRGREMKRPRRKIVELPELISVAGPPSSLDSQP